MEVLITKFHFEEYPVKDVVTGFEISSIEDLIPQLLKEIKELLKLWDNQADWNYDLSNAQIECEGIDDWHMPSYSDAEILLKYAENFPEEDLTGFFHQEPMSNKEVKKFWEDFEAVHRNFSEEEITPATEEDIL